MKKCNKCEETKDLSSFHKRTSKKDGLDCWCKVCVKAYSKNAYATNEKLRLRSKEIAFRRKYKFSLQEYDNLAIKQNFRCKSCGEEEKSPNSYKTGILPLAVDHDHLTGKVRGLLCSRCNKALGLLDDSPLKIEALLKYLQNNNALITQMVE